MGSVTGCITVNRVDFPGKFDAVDMAEKMVSTVKESIRMGIPPCSTLTAYTSEIGMCILLDPGAPDAQEKCGSAVRAWFKKMGVVVKAYCILDVVETDKPEDMPTAALVHVVAPTDTGYQWLTRVLHITQGSIQEVDGEADPSLTSRYGGFIQI